MPRAVDHDSRRETLCDIVVELAARDGFAAVTIRAVAAASRSSTSSVTHYVASRGELIGLAVRREIDRQKTRIQRARQGQGVQALHSMASAAALETTDREQRFWMAIVVGALHDPVLARELADFNAWWDQLSGAVLDEMSVTAQAASDLADMADVVTAGMITATLEAPAHWTPGRRERVLRVLFEALAGTQPAEQHRAG